VDYIQEALKEALKSKLTDWHIGAVLVRGGNIIGRGHNRYSANAHFLSRKLNKRIWSLHAEMDAIFPLLKRNADLSDTTMYVTGIKSNGRGVNCKPCTICANLLNMLGITVFYTNKSGEIKTDEP
jgi:tRNA(Arg) A34 adenosine deaminase TadA